MKFKIFCVVIIAASIAVILALALTGKEDVPGQVQTAAQADVKPRVRPEVPILPEGAVPQESADAKKAVMESVASSERQESAATDRVDVIKMSVSNPFLFESLNTKDRVAAISVALNMNEEQEVMLSSYLEARYSFMGSREAKDFANGILNTGRRQGSVTGANVRPEMNFDQITDVVNIMAQELKEIQGLKNAFLGELTKQQREKLDALPIINAL